MDIRPFSRLLMGSSNILSMLKSEKKSSTPDSYLTTVDRPAGHRAPRFGYRDRMQLRRSFRLSRVVWRSQVLPKSNTGQPERSGQRALLTGLSAASLAAWLANSEAFALSCQVVRKIFIRLLGS
jgi:hypothetical protein